MVNCPRPHPQVTQDLNLVDLTLVPTPSSMALPSPSPSPRLEQTLVQPLPEASHWLMSSPGQPGSQVPAAVKLECEFCFQIKRILCKGLGL